MSYFPLFLDIQDKPVLLVGGGEVAARKYSLLVEAGAKVSVVAPLLGEELGAALARGEFTHHAREFAEPDIEGAWLVVAATYPSVTRATADAHVLSRVRRPPSSAAVASAISGRCFRCQYSGTLTMKSAPYIHGMPPTIFCAVTLTPKSGSSSRRASATPC